MIKEFSGFRQWQGGATCPDTFMGFLWPGFKIQKLYNNNPFFVFWHNTKLTQLKGPWLLCQEALNFCRRTCFVLTWNEHGYLKTSVAAALLVEKKTWIVMAISCFILDHNCYSLLFDPGINLFEERHFVLDN